LIEGRGRADKQPEKAKEEAKEAVAINVGQIEELAGNGVNVLILVPRAAQQDLTAYLPKVWETALRWRATSVVFGVPDEDQASGDTGPEQGPALKLLLALLNRTTPAFTIVALFPDPDVELFGGQELTGQELTGHLAQRELATSALVTYIEQRSGPQNAGR